MSYRVITGKPETFPAVINAAVMGRFEICHAELFLSLPKDVARNWFSFCLKIPTEQGGSEMLRFARHDMGSENHGFHQNFTRYHGGAVMFCPLTSRRDKRNLTDSLTALEQVSWL